MKQRVPTSNRRMVLIDDDPAFCTIMRSFAQTRGIELDDYPNLESMGSIGKMSQYAVAIVDYDLGSMNGVEIAEYLPVFFGELPMVLISGQSRSHGGKPWPSSIRNFVHKDVGPDAILDAAIEHLPPVMLEA